MIFIGYPLLIMHFLTLCLKNNWVFQKYKWVFQKSEIPEKAAKLSVSLN